MASEWLSQAEAARRLGVSRRVIRSMLRDGLVTTRQLPKYRLQLRAEDVDRIDRESIKQPEPAQAG